MKWIGLTGGIGSGKSTVSKRLRELGFTVVDADELAREVVRPRSVTWTKIVTQFGKEILNSDETIDRKKLGQLVFSNPILLKCLEGFIHPEVKRRVEEEKQAALKRRESVAFYDVPLLYENQMENEFDAVLVIYCTEEQQIQRVSARDHLDVHEIQHRLNRQIKLIEKSNKADVVIDNSGSQAELLSQIDKALKGINLK
jgi:dephospho-CoA kinase